MSSTLIAGEVDLIQLLSELSKRRPAFHSEADFQFALAQSLSTAADVEIRLEVRLDIARAEYVDVLCSGSRGTTMIELKYPTTSWAGRDPFGEEFATRTHAAYDLARRYFVHDVARLERFVLGRPGTTGVAIMLTNEPGLWSEPKRQGTRDAAFRIHEGVELFGRRTWGVGDRQDLDEVLRGRYPLRWHDYSELEGSRGRFRWCAVEVTPGREGV